jgi:hypothetical protein
MHMTRRPAAFAGLILTLALAGCGQKPAPSAPSSNAPVADPNAVALGKTNTAGPFQVTLSMPTMGMPGPSGALTWKDGLYTGKVQAGMAGHWQADVSVKAAVETGTAAFTFAVKE